MPPISVPMVSRNYFEGIMKPCTTEQAKAFMDNRFDNRAQNGINLIKWRIRWIQHHKGKPNDAGTDRIDR